MFDSKAFRVSLAALPALALWVAPTAAHAATLPAPGGGEASGGYQIPCAPPFQQTPFTVGPLHLVGAMTIGVVSVPVDLTTGTFNGSGFCAFPGPTFGVTLPSPTFQAFTGSFSSAPVPVSGTTEYTVAGGSAQGEGALVSVTATTQHAQVVGSCSGGTMTITESEFPAFPPLPEMTTACELSVGGGAPSAVNLDLRAVPLTAPNTVWVYTQS